MKLYLINGASGSGKTAILEPFKKLTKNKVTAYDFDDIGVPENADKVWRQKSTELWLQKILQENKDACLFGQIVLGEVLACPSAHQFESIYCYFLDVTDFERIKRLKKRGTYGADQNMLNWSSWLRMHHQDPQWEQHVIKDGSWSGLDFAQWDTLQNWSNLVQVKLIDTTNLSIKKAAQKLAGLI